MRNFTVDEEPNQHIVDSLPLESVTTHSNVNTRNENMADEVICQKFLLEVCGCSDVLQKIYCWPNCQEKNLTWL